MVVLADKEEIGSEGATGMQCAIFVDLIDAIADSFGVSSAAVRAHSKCLSADVNAGYDPNFRDVCEPLNSTYLSHGAGLTKFTGSRGKGGSNDASAEFVGEVRKLFDDNGVIWQTGELGRVDVGGGGTVAKFIANMNIDTVDIGVPVISMHAPYEVVSKADVYKCYRAFCSFIK
jgi:aspartyl aminopeptidase